MQKSFPSLVSPFLLFVSICYMYRSRLSVCHQSNTPSSVTLSFSPVRRVKIKIETVPFLCLRNTSTEPHNTWHKTMQTPNTHGSTDEYTHTQNMHHSGKTVPRSNTVTILVWTPVLVMLEASQLLPKSTMLPLTKQPTAKSFTIRSSLTNS